MLLHHFKLIIKSCKIVIIHQNKTNKINNNLLKNLHLIKNYMKMLFQYRKVFLILDF